MFFKTHCNTLEITNTTHFYMQELYQNSKCSTDHNIEFSFQLFLCDADPNKVKMIWLMFDRVSVLFKNTRHKT